MRVQAAPQEIVGEDGGGGVDGSPARDAGRDERAAN